MIKRRENIGEASFRHFFIRNVKSYGKISNGQGDALLKSSLSFIIKLTVMVTYCFIPYNNGNDPGDGLFKKNRSVAYSIVRSGTLQWKLI